jgi:aspartate/methionine/tyrosine aminotransferase
MSRRFDDDAVPLSVLRERAFNLRWATLPDDVIPLTAADPDFPAAPEITEAIRAYCSKGVYSYGPPEGLPAFRATAARFLHTRRQLSVTPDTVFPTNSAASAMVLAAQYLLTPGDEALIPDPVDFLFQTSVESAGAVPVRYPVTRSNRLDLDDLRSRVTPRTRLLCICNPHNPLGIVFSRTELEALGEFALEHDLQILSDEVWADIVYTGRSHISIASLDDAIASRTLTVFGFSKTFGLAGLRVGLLAAPSKAIVDEIRVQSGANATAYGVSTLSQIGAQAALESGWSWFAEFLDHLQSMRDMVVGRVQGWPGITCQAPEGTYVIFANIQERGVTATDLSAELLRSARVAVVPGAPRWFGPGAEGHIRLCFASSRGILTEALDRIETVLG